MKLFLLILKNVRRNVVRTGLTVLGTVFLVLVVTLVWSALTFLTDVTSSTRQDFKAIITEKWQIPSQMPFSYAATLSEGAARNPGDVKPSDSMTWQFYGGTLDLKNRTTDNSLFAFAMEPDKLLTMMDDLDTLPASQTRDLAAAIEKMKKNRQTIIIGPDRLAAIGKKIGDRIKLYGLNYPGIDLEFEIVGTFPIPRYADSAAFDRDYLNAALDAWPREHNGQKHPLADKCLNLVWLRVPDAETFDKLNAQIASSPLYSSPSVKCEVSSSAIGTFMAGFRDIFFAMRWILGPAVLASLSIIIAISISISVRERQMEIAVMKVLGFRPVQILLLVLGEALLLGAGSGLFSSALTYVVINYGMGGIPFRIAFFPSFGVPIHALWWGAAIGAAAALLGSLLPAWNACRVKVTEVFSRVA